MRDEYRKCFLFVLILNIASWVLFIILDAIAEIILKVDRLLDGGLISIPCILTIFYVIVESKIFDTVRFKIKFNIFLICIFLIIVFLFGILDFFFLFRNIYFVPQRLNLLNGIEYVIFPFSYGIISLLLGLILKIIIYVLYKIKFCHQK